MLVIFDMLMSLFERAYLVAYKPKMSETEARRWNSWDDYMREWCRRDDFHNALPLLLRGEDPQFQEYIAPHCRRGARPQPAQSATEMLKGASMSDSIVIVGAARTPMGGFQGDFSALSAHDLGGAAIKAAVERAGISGEPSARCCSATA